MAATYDVQEGNGSSVTWTTITSGRYCTVDVYNPGTQNPIPIPSAGSFNWSYWKSHCLNVGGTFTVVNNVRWYTDGTIGWALGTSGKLFVAKLSGTMTIDHGCPDASYVDASGTPGTTGNSVIAGDATGHSYYSGEILDLASAYISTSALTIDLSGVESAGRTNHVVTQVSVDDDATQGAQTAETLTFIVDET